jgi:hypothetical protein
LLFKASSRSVRLQGLLEVGPVRLLAAMLGDLGISTLHSIKTMTQFSSLFGASNQPCCLLQCLGTTLRVRLRRPLVFPHHTDLLGNPFLITPLLDLFSLLSFWNIMPAILPAMMLGYYSMSASLMPSEIFSSSFRSIGSLLLIGRQSTSLRFGKTSNRSAAKLICFSFFFWTDVHAIRPVNSSTTSS